MIALTLDYLVSHLPAYLEANPDEADCWETEPDVWDTHKDRLEDYLGNCRQSVLEELAKRGLNIMWCYADETITIRDTEAMTRAARLINEITWEYDCTVGRDQAPTSWWTDLSLGGDDDVDYNGSYLDIAFGLINHVLPEDYRSHIDPEAPTYNDYHLPHLALGA